MFGTDLFGNGFAVQFVVDFPDLGHGERGDGDGIEAEGHLLLRDQRHQRGGNTFRLGVLTWRHRQRQRVRERQLHRQPWRHTDRITFIERQEKIERQTDNNKQMPCILKRRTITEPRS